MLRERGLHESAAGVTMITAEQPHSLDEVIDRVIEKTGGERVSLGEILESLGTSAYGPALLAVSVISMLPPISVTPGLPVVTGTLILLLSIQLLVHRPYPWLPKWVLRFSFSREKLTKVADRARPWAKRLNRLIGPRLQFLVGPPFLNVIAVICIVLAVMVFVLSPLPAGENIPAAAVLFFGLALTARDGLLALIGLAVTAGAVGALVYFWPTIVQGMADLAAAVGLGGGS
jgi:hypothetical protein